MNPVLHPVQINHECLGTNECRNQKERHYFVEIQHFIFVDIALVKLNKKRLKFTDLVHVLRFLANFEEVFAKKDADRWKA